MTSNNYNRKNYQGNVINFFKLFFQYILKIVFYPIVKTAEIAEKAEKEGIDLNFDTENRLQENVLTIKKKPTIKQRKRWLLLGIPSLITGILILEKYYNTEMDIFTGAGFYITLISAIMIILAIFPGIIKFIRKK